MSKLSLSGQFITQLALISDLSTTVRQQLKQIGFSSTCDQRLKCASNRLSFSNGSVDKVEKIRLGMAGVQVGRFAGVDHRASSHGHVDIEGLFLGKGDGLLEAAPQINKERNSTQLGGRE